MTTSREVQFWQHRKCYFQRKIAQHGRYLWIWRVKHAIACERLALAIYHSEADDYEDMSVDQFLALMRISTDTLTHADA